jgi:hypothetical protein
LFFFEKKNQKTFVSGRFAVRLAPGSMGSRFFQKEVFPACRPAARH